MALCVDVGVAQTQLPFSLLEDPFFDGVSELISPGGARRIISEAHARGGINTRKVEIPETGVSIVELERELRRSFGNETRVSGDVWRTPQGIAMTVHAGNKAAT